MARLTGSMPLAAIIGHAPIVALLKQAVRRGSVPQSLLFAGPDGVGKRAVAVALAQAINCPKRGAPATTPAGSVRPASASRAACTRMSCSSTGRRRVDQDRRRPRARARRDRLPAVRGGAPRLHHRLRPRTSASRRRTRCSRRSKSRRRRPCSSSSPRIRIRCGRPSSRAAAGCGSVRWSRPMSRAS